MSNKKKILATLAIATLIIINTNSIFAKTGIVTTETLRVRKAASTDSTILEMVNHGDKIEIIGEEGDWYKVTVNGKNGYVSKEYVKITNEQTTTQSPKPTPSTTPSSTPVVTSSNTPVTTPSSTPTEITPTTTPEPSPVETTTPSPEPEQPVKENINMVLGDITNREINIYIIPSFSSIKISKIGKDKKVQIIKTLGNWSKVSTDNIEGWIPNSAIMVEVQN